MSEGLSRHWDMSSLEDEKKENRRIGEFSQTSGVSEWDNIYIYNIYVCVLLYIYKIELYVMYVFHIFLRISRTRKRCWSFVSALEHSLAVQGSQVTTSS